VKSWNWPLVWFLASGLFNVVFRRKTSPFFRLIRAFSFDPVAALYAIRGFIHRDEPEIEVIEEEGPTPARPSKLPTVKTSVFIKPDGPDSD